MSTISSAMSTKENAQALGRPFIKGEHCTTRLAHHLVTEIKEIDATKQSRTVIGIIALAVSIFIGYYYSFKIALGVCLIGAIVLGSAVRLQQKRILKIAELHEEISNNVATLYQQIHVYVSALLKVAERDMNAIIDKKFPPSSSEKPRITKADIDAFNETYAKEESANTKEWKGIAGNILENCAGPSVVAGLTKVSALEADTHYNILRTGCGRLINFKAEVLLEQSL